MCVQSIKVPIRKKSGNLLNDPRIPKSIYFNFFIRVIISTNQHLSYVVRMRW